MNPEEEMVAVFSSSNHDAEMEALAVQGVLESNGFDVQMVGPSTLPSLRISGTGAGGSGGGRARSNREG